ncbi:hypothetical protein CspeluHIS016_0110540 [Cutaneotrichosporon spelunceum]|uniref:DUF1272 domain-containing protein n=1 Tax=Cutaneotrichosporon spelunceum TaxID=1672016 RepID=A0AAD3TPU1_9TREE|nr:hypothetical protein CspeluHIS016_0110540 [Cutaneotrichosporon spelunceum]
MLELRPNCESCNADIPPQSPDAWICTFECTWCTACATGKLALRCPNCAGNLQPRPIRPADMLERFPASAKRVFKNAP